MSSDWETQELKLRRKNADLDRQRASLISDRGTTSGYPSISDITRSKIPIKVELRAKKPQGPHSHTEGSESQNLYAQCMVQLKTRNEENAKLRKELEDCRKEFRNLSSNQVETHKTAQVLQDQALKLASNEIIELKRENQVLQKDLQVAKDADLKSKSHIEKISLEVRRLSAVNQDLEYQLKDCQVSSKKEQKASLHQMSEKDKQIKTLFKAIQKQSELIHVLKQQRLHLEALKVLEFSEEEFLETLDWPKMDAKRETSS